MSALPCRRRRRLLRPQHPQDIPSDGQPQNSQEACATYLAPPSTGRLAVAPLPNAGLALRPHTSSPLLILNDDLFQAGSRLERQESLPNGGRRKKGCASCDFWGLSGSHDAVLSIMNDQDRVLVTHQPTPRSVDPSEGKIRHPRHPSRRISGSGSGSGSGPHHPSWTGPMPGPGSKWGGLLLLLLLGLYLI